MAGSVPVASMLPGPLPGGGEPGRGAPDCPAMTTTAPLALLDLDGTLLDSAPGIIASIRTTFAELGLPPLTDDQLHQFVGPPLPASMRMFGVPEERIPETVARYRVHFEAGGMLHAEVFPGIPEQLRRLRAAGITLAVATSKPEIYARPICDHFGLTDLLDGTYGAPTDDIPSTKATVIAHALAELGPDRVPDPERTLMVGDRHHDVTGAAEHRFACLGAGWGYAQPGELDGAVEIVAEPAGLAEAILARLA